MCIYTYIYTHIHIHRCLYSLKMDRFVVGYVHLHIPVFSVSDPTERPTRVGYFCILPRMQGDEPPPAGESKRPKAKAKARGKGKCKAKAKAKKEPKEIPGCMDKSSTIICY